MVKAELGHSGVGGWRPMWRRWAGVMVVDGERVESRPWRRLIGIGQRNSRRLGEKVIHSRREEAANCSRNYGEMAL